MSQPANLDHDHDRHRRAAAPPTYERRLALLKQHDAQVCVCGHRCISHGSYDHRRTFIGVGLGPCGWPRCDCDHFHSSGTSSDTGTTPVPYYDREPSDEQINTTCDDCQAPPGDPCHWACSSWWA